MGYRDFGFSEVKACGMPVGVSCPACLVLPFPVLYAVFLDALPGKGNKKSNIEHRERQHVPCLRGSVYTGLCIYTPGAAVPL